MAATTTPGSRPGDDGRAPRRLAYLPGLDRLRGLFVAVVVLYHAGLGWATGGFLGVDGFFVLSGFLITTLLIREKAGVHRVSLRGFWGRRTRRLLPPLLLTLVAVSAYAATLPADAAQRIRGDALSALFYVANWRMVAVDTSYFDALGAPSPLLHTWSLAIEEQFYVLWPLVVAAVGAFQVYGRHTRRRPPTWLPLGLLAGAGAVGSAVWMAVSFSPDEDPSRLYFGTDTRLQTVLVGALAAVLYQRVGAERLGRWLRPLAVPALGALLVGYVALDDLSAVLYRGGFLVVAVLSAVVVLAVASGGPAAAPSPVGGGAAAPLRWAGEALRGLGLISYGLYLYHWPVFVVLDSGRTGLDGPALLAVRLGVSLALAVASYRWVERPILEGRLLRAPERRWARLAVAPAAVGLTAVVVLGVTAVPEPERDEQQTALAAIESGELSRRLPLLPPPEAGPTEVASPGSAPRTDADLPADGAATGTAEEPEPAPPPPPPPERVLVLGDSVAATLAWYWQDLGDDELGPRATERVLGADPLIGCGVNSGVSITEGQPWFPPEQCADWEGRWARTVDFFRPDTTLMLSGAWEVFDQQVGGQLLPVGSEAYRRHLDARLDAFARLATAHGGRVVWALTPCMGPDPDAVMAGLTERQETWRVEWFNQAVRDLAARNPSVVTVDLFSFLCPSGSYERERDGEVLRHDGAHLTEAGGRVVLAWLLDQLDALPDHRAAAG